MCSFMDTVQALLFDIIPNFIERTTKYVYQEIVSPDTTHNQIAATPEYRQQNIDNHGSLQNYIPLKTAYWQTK